MTGYRYLTGRDLALFGRYWQRTAPIEGWLTATEALVLFARARRPEIGSILEIGCWKGRSSSLLAQIARDEGKRFATVDDFSGRGALAARAAAERVRAAFRTNMHALPYELFESSSSQTVVRERGPFDLVFIDGCHDYDYVRADIEASLPGARCIVGHDYSEPGVRAAVEELVPDRTLPVVDMWMWERGAAGAGST